MKDDSIIWLQSWYQSQCDGDWEHTYGIKIQTLDNPGWLILIDLLETELENVAFDNIKIRRSKNNWISCLLKDGKFQGAGGVHNLNEILDIFQTWVKANPKSSS